MASSFEDTLKQQRDSWRQTAQSDYDQAASANQAATDQYLASTDAIFQENAQRLEQAYNQRISQLPQDYQYAYDKNAIQQAINEREVAGRMEQLGLTDSGLNRTQQTAINVQRSNADAAVTQQQNAQLNALSSALAEQLAQNASNQATSKAQAQYDLAIRNQDLYNTYMTNANSMAASAASAIYSADQQRAAAEAQAAAQQAQADAALQQAQSEATANAEKELRDLAWNMAQSDADSGNIPEGQNILDVYNTYLNGLMGSGTFTPTHSDYSSKLELARIYYPEGKSGLDREQSEASVDRLIFGWLQDNELTWEEALQIYKELGIYKTSDELSNLGA